MERPLTRNIRADRAPLDLAGYEAAGGYQALRKVVREVEPMQVIEAVKASGLKGRGGAGFPTGSKWELVPKEAQGRLPIYLVANADEMEPGTFKDRYLLEGDPHQFIEGMICSAYAIGAEKGFIFLRWAYKRAARLLRQAIAEARAQGYLGPRILGTSFRLELHVHISAGRYICGEETAMLNALEGKRAIPRSKPPYPGVAGVWGKPTVVNNVETLCNVPHIINNGPEWFHALARSPEGGTKIYGLSGHVKRPGAWELPLGVTLRELLEEYGGGMSEGRAFRGALPGGASTDFITRDHFDVPMDFGSMMKAGTRLGTGTAIVLDDRTCPVGMVLNLEEFFAQESCGWCTPCREGLPWVRNLLRGIEAGKGQAADLDVLQEHTGLLGLGHTFCALAPGAVEPLQSALLHFRPDFERHLTARKCPWSNA